MRYLLKIFAKLAYCARFKNFFLTCGKRFYAPARRQNSAIPVRWWCSRLLYAVWGMTWIICFQATTASTQSGTISANLKWQTRTWRLSGSWCKMKICSGIPTSWARPLSLYDACAPGTAACRSPTPTPMSWSSPRCWSTSPLSSTKLLV